MKRNAFTLLEVLIVLALVTLFLPIVLYPLRQTAKDIQLDLSEKELAKAVRFALANFLVKMHQEPPPFDSLGDEQSLPIPLEWFQGSSLENSVTGSYIIKKKKKDKEAEENVLQLWEVIFTLKTRVMKEAEAMQFNYQFITRRKNSETGKPSA